MPLLPYCVVLSDAAVVEPACGVHEAQVEWLDESALRCFFSRLGTFAAGSAEALKEDALRFHSVLHGIFTQAAVIPFRFPTTLESEQELRRFLNAGASSYREALIRLRDLVQMELRVSIFRAESTTPSSGREYLLARQAQARLLAEGAAAAQAIARGLIQDWREHESKSALRCYALVPRADIGEFESRMRALDLPKGVRMVVSGPWPATEFLEVRVGA
jgi:hypothetical protein